MNFSSIAPVQKDRRTRVVVCPPHQNAESCPNNWNKIPQAAKSFLIALVVMSDCFMEWSYLIFLVQRKKSGWLITIDILYYNYSGFLTNISFYRHCLLKYTTPALSSPSRETSSAPSPFPQTRLATEGQRSALGQVWNHMVGGSSQQSAPESWLLTTKLHFLGRK